MFQLVFHTSVS